MNKIQKVGTYKTWEVVKELTEHPNKKFTYGWSGGESWITNMKGSIVWQGKGQHNQPASLANTNIDWTEIDDYDYSKHEDILEQVKMFVKMFNNIEQDCVQTDSKVCNACPLYNICIDLDSISKGVKIL